MDVIAWDNSSAKLKILNFVAIKKKKKFTWEESLERLKFVLGKVSRSVYSKWKISVEVTSIFHSSIHMKVIPLFLSGQLNGRIVEKLIRFHRLLLPFSSLYNSVEEFQSYIARSSPRGLAYRLMRVTNIFVRELGLFSKQLDDVFLSR